jgi:hypothetical protein
MRKNMAAQTKWCIKNPIPARRQVTIAVAAGALHGNDSRGADAKANEMPS